MIVKPSSFAARANVFTAFIVGVAALRLARDVLMPFALAILLSFLLAPLVIFLQRRVGRIVAVLAVTLMTFILLVGTSWFMVDQVSRLSQKLPENRQNIIDRIRSLRGSMSGGFGPASQAVGDITEALSAEVPSDAPNEPVVPEVKSVEAAERAKASPGRTLWPWVNSITAQLADVAVVIVFVIFILLYYDDLRDRILRLIGTGRLNASTQAINDAAARVSRYLLMQTVINMSHGIAVAVGLYFLGVPAALFFGLTSAILRFIPYLGPVVAAVMPIALALAVFDGWTWPLLTVGFFIVLEIVSNNVVEPWLYGSSTGLSPMAVIVAAVFWSWLWGPIGLVLSAPLTVCLVVLGKHVARLNFLSILLSDQPVLEPKERLYHRLLVLDQEGGLEVAEEYLKGRSLEKVYDDVLIPALAMSELDRHRGDQDDVREKFILENMREIIEELGGSSSQPGQSTADATLKSNPHTSTRVNILCLPARDEADELGGVMFAQLLEQDGHRARCISGDALAGEMLDIVENEGVQVVCVSALPPAGGVHARYLCKRLRSRFERLNIVVGLWTTPDDQPGAVSRTKRDKLVQVVTTLAAGRALVGQLAQATVLDGSDRKLAVG